MHVHCNQRTALRRLRLPPLCGKRPNPPISTVWLVNARTSSAHSSVSVVAGRPARCAIVRDGHPHASLGATSIRAGDWKKCGNAKSGSTAWKTRESIATMKSRNAHVDFLQEICESDAACNVQCNWERCEILSITNYSYWKGITTTINAY